MLIAVGGVWLAWLAGWINRVELRMRAEPAATALALVFDAEGALARVVARGEVAGVPVRLRWRVGWFGRAVDFAVREEAWSVVPGGVEIVEWVRGRVGEATVVP